MNKRRLGKLLSWLEEHHHTAVHQRACVSAVGTATAGKRFEDIQGPLLEIQRMLQTERRVTIAWITAVEKEQKRRLSRYAPEPSIDEPTSQLSPDAQRLLHEMLAVCTRMGVLPEEM